MNKHINNKSTQKFAALVLVLSVCFMTLTDCSVSGLRKNETKLKDAIIAIFNRMNEWAYYTEHVEFPSFSGANVSVWYFPMYIWHESDRKNEKLIKISAEGVTCFLSVPNASEDEPRQLYRPDYYVLNIASLPSGEYYTEDFSFYKTSTRGLEECLNLYPADYRVLDVSFPVFSKQGGDNS